MKPILKIVTLLLVATGVAGIGAYYFTPAGQATLVQFEISSHTDGVSQLFWSDRRDSFREEDSASFSLK